MEWKNLQAFALMMVLVAMIVGVGIITLDKFGAATYEDLSIVNESFTWMNGTTITLTFHNMTAFSRILNENATQVNADNYTVNLTYGTVWLMNDSVCPNGITCYAYYTTRNYETPAKAATRSGMTSIAAINNTWLSLVITIGVLAIILGLVVAGFVSRSRNR